METIEIFEVFEQNKLRDFAFYECGFLHKTILPYLTDEQELFLLVNDDLHRKGKYKTDDFIISLDEIWHFLGHYHQFYGLFCENQEVSDHPPLFDPLHSSPLKLYKMQSRCGMRFAAAPYKLCFSKLGFGFE